MFLRFDLLEKGGPIVGLIFLLSIPAVGVFLERLVVIFSTKFNKRAFKKACADLVSNGKVDDSNLSNLTKRFFRHVVKSSSYSKDILEDSLSYFIENEMNRLYRHTGILPVTAEVAPMLGLLGTVTGLIKSFMVIESFGGRVNASALAGGMWEALLTTAVGLSVAIPVVLLQSFLEWRIGIIRLELEESANDFVEMVLKARNG